MCGDRTIGPEEAARFEREETERFYRDHPEVIPCVKEIVAEAVERLREDEREDTDRG